MTISPDTAAEQAPVLPKYTFGPWLQAGDVPDWVRNEANLINDALDAGRITLDQAEHGLRDDAEIRDLMHDRMGLTYFVEYPPENLENLEDRGHVLQALFAQETTDADGETMTLADYMAKHKQSVALAMITLDKPTADAVRYLTDRGVPVNAWIVIDDNEGYWTNRTSMKATEDRTEEVIRWINDEKLDITTIGFDIEKPMPFIAEMVKKGPLGLLSKEAKQYRQDAKAVQSLDGDGEAHMARLIRSVQSRYIEAEVYTMPRLAKKMLGGMDIDPAVPNRYIEMDYTQDMPVFLRKNGLAARLFRNNHAIPALGIVTGDGTRPGRKLTEDDDKAKYLTPQELADSMHAILKREVDVEDRRLGLERFYIFALNDARVAAMATAALRGAFDQLPVSKHGN